MRAFIRLLRLLRPHALVATLAVLLAVATVAAGVGLMAAAAYLISASALRLLLIQLSVPIQIVRLLAVSRAFLRYWERLVSHNVTLRILRDLRVGLYDRLHPLAPARLSGYRSGDVLARVTKDVDELQGLYQQALAPLLVACAVILVTCGLLGLFNPALALTGLVTLLLAAAGVPALVAVLVRGLGRRQLQLRGELEGLLVDGMRGLQDLLVSGRVSDYAQRIARSGRELGAVERRAATAAGLELAAGEFLAALGVVAILVVAIPLVSGGALEGVFLAAVALLFLASFEVVAPLGQALRALGRSLAAGHRLFELTDCPPAVAAPPAPLPSPTCHTLEFVDVTFAYDSEEPPALEHFGLILQPGRRVAIVGPSGAGKSTVVNLALRFWDPTYGEIRMGGRDLRELSQEDLRESIAVVAQDTYLFNDTLRANLLLARPGATGGQLDGALRHAGLTELVEQLPQGLDTWIGEEGARLSGGERQRVAIARALLKDAPLLVVDEATANLDTVTEGEVMAALWEAMAARGTLVITHRLVGMENMDEILVLDRGRVVERGTHGELLLAGGLYRRMLDIQNQVLAA